MKTAIGLEKNGNGKSARLATADGASRGAKGAADWLRSMGLGDVLLVPVEDAAYWRMRACHEGTALRRTYSTQVYAAEGVVRVQYAYDMRRGFAECCGSLTRLVRVPGAMYEAAEAGAAMSSEAKGEQPNEGKEVKDGTSDI